MMDLLRTDIKLIFFRSKANHWCWTSIFIRRIWLWNVERDLDGRNLQPLVLGTVSFLKRFFSSCSCFFADIFECFRMYRAFCPDLLSRIGSKLATNVLDRSTCKSRTDVWNLEMYIARHANFNQDVALGTDSGREFGRRCCRESDIQLWFGGKVHAHAYLCFVRFRFRPGIFIYNRMIMQCDIDHLRLQIHRFAWTHCKRLGSSRMQFAGFSCHGLISNPAYHVLRDCWLDRFDPSLNSYFLSNFTKIHGTYYVPTRQACSLS